MKLLMVRHAPAQEREDFFKTNQKDSERPLTKEGIKKMQSAALGIKKICMEVDSIASSPFKRALQTAEILLPHYNSPLHIWDELAAGADTKGLIYKLKNTNKKSILIVGHEPDFGIILSELCTKPQESNLHPHFFGFKKGGAACVEFYDEIESGKATLLWALQPAHLRALSTVV